MMSGTYDPGLVALSFAVAVLTSYTALDLASRVTIARGPTRLAWLAGGAAAMGLGIWAMHFIGMLALTLPMPVSYDLSRVQASLLAAIVASGLALFVVSRRSMRWPAWLAGGGLLGLGITIMHYTGMASMRMPATIQYAPAPFALSIVLAVGVSLAALWLTFRLRSRVLMWCKLGSAVTMGAAICGTHYLGMQAVSFVPTSIASARMEGELTAPPLAIIAIGVSAILVLGLTSLAALQDQRLSARKALRESETRLQTLITNLPVVVSELDHNGVYTLSEGKGLEKLGRKPGDVVGRSIFEVHADNAELLAHTRRALAGESFTSTVEIGGEVFEIRWTPLRDQDGRVSSVIRVGVNVSERARAEETLRHQALHDTLTGLPNRALLQSRLRQAIAAAQSGTEILALLLLDLDRFKEINDTFGHHAGDLLLQQVGARLLRTLRSSDTVARLGGDEFAIVLTAGDKQSVAETARRVLAAFEAPFVVEGQPFEVGTSIGIAYYPDHGDDVQTLLRRADVAMYVAKRAHSGYVVYTCEQDQHSPDRLALVADLRHAIARGELLLHYQPKAAIASGHISGVEALARWSHPQRGLVPPDQFIPLAEQTGLIGALTLWVLDAALRQCRDWRRQGLDLGVAVNLSTHSLLDARLPHTIADLLNTYQIPPGKLRLEITESSIMADPARAQEVLTRLSALGVCIAIDDFGTGYSSLAYLKRLPVNELKIDKSFVSHMREDRTDAAIVSSTIGLAHSLGLHVVAEGVEDSETWDLLATLGCDTAQGYYLSRPLPPDELARRVAGAPQAVA